MSAVAHPDEGPAAQRATANAADEALAISAAFHPSTRDDQLDDAATEEFALGFGPHISFGTPPPPSRANLYAARLGASGRHPRMGPAVGAIIVILALALGLVYLSQRPPARPLAITEGPLAAPSTSDGTGTGAGNLAQGPASSAPTPIQTTSPDPPPPARDPLVPESSALPTGPVITGPTAVPFGQSLLLDVTDLPCGAGAHLDVSLKQSGPEALVANGSTITDAAGKASIHVYVVNVKGTPGQVERLTDPPSYLTLAPGVWTLRAAIAPQAACTATASATTMVTVTPAS